MPRAGLDGLMTSRFTCAALRCAAFLRGFPGFGHLLFQYLFHCAAVSFGKGFRPLFFARLAAACRLRLLAAASRLRAATCRGE